MREWRMTAMAGIPWEKVMISETPYIHVFKEIDN